MSKQNELIEILKAMGEPTRFGIIKLLCTTNKQLCVTALSKKLDVSQPVISQHLKILKNSKIVDSQREGYHIHYSINRKTLEKVSKELHSFTKIPAEPVTVEPCNPKEKKHK